MDNSAKRYLIGFVELSTVTACVPKDFSSYLKAFGSRIKFEGSVKV